MSLLPPAPCDWPWEPCPCSDFDDVWPAEETDIVAQASYLLWAATGKMYGPCPTSVLPCRDVVVCGSCYEPLRRCGCTRVSELRLPGPVHSIIEVVIDAMPVDEFAYRVEDYLWLVRIDGGVWPTNVDPTDPDGFRVDYNLGLEPPAGAAAATGELACEIAKSRCGHPSCRLPSNVRSLTRQGVRVEIGPGQFGLYAVDKWLEADRLPLRAGAVHTPDFPLVRHITWEASSSPTSPTSP